MLTIKTTAFTGLQPSQVQLEKPSYRKLLIVDDEVALLTLLENLFADVYEVQTAESGDYALTLLSQGFMPEVIIADQRMPGISGAEFLAKANEFVPNAVRVILTGYADVAEIIDSINLGHAYRFLTKPWKNADLLEAVRLSFEHYDVSTQNAALTKALVRLEEANKALAEMNYERREILRIVAHDLKNPLSSVRTSVEIILEADELTPTLIATLAKVIDSSAERGIELIDHLLKVEMIESGSMPIMVKPIHIDGLVLAIVERYRLQAARKGINIHYANSPELIALADDKALMQVVDNLLSNAVKYSPHGKNVWVSAHKAEALSGLLSVPCCLIRVKDEGPGISAADQTKLFGKFVRLTAQPTGGEHSTGLGLSIVKRLVELMNACVWCESEAGSGATFCVEFPAYVEEVTNDRHQVNSRYES